MTSPDAFNAMLDEDLEREATLEGRLRRIAVFDLEHHLVRINPIVDWNRERIEAYLDANRVPINLLNRQGFLSIGCQPCTRAVPPGEASRGGRWWWEGNSGEKERSAWA
jgi:3'-phosphoadenosine 5'-phosphosulfate sulfotransferase (PAPS reductase)/FAD synthetase